TAPDFQIREGGRPQKEISVAPQAGPLTAVLAIDTGMGAKLLREGILSGLKNYLDTVAPADQVLALGFSESVTVLAPLTNQRALTLEGVSRAVPHGKTALLDALFTALSSLRNVAGR